MYNTTVYGDLRKIADFVVASAQNSGLKIGDVAQKSPYRYISQKYINKTSLRKGEKEYE